LLIGLTKLTIRLRDDCEEASIFVDKVNIPFIFEIVQTGVTKVVLSYEEQGIVPILFVVE